MILWVVVAGCSAGGTGSKRRIEPPCVCDGGLVCTDAGECVVVEDAGQEDAGAPDACVGEACDGGMLLQCDPPQVECGGVCCDGTQMCLDDQCVAACADVSRLCGDEQQFCCSAIEACIGEQCVEPGPECTFSEECALDELCDPGLGRCIPRDVVNVCEFRPPVGVFTPRLGCRWDPPALPDPTPSGNEPRLPEMREVVMTPAVANLSDDNGDGVTNTLDTPDIVFVSFDYEKNGCCTRFGVVQVVSGACNQDGSMTTLATLRGENDTWIDNSTGIALGNLHADTDTANRNPEIVATIRGGGTVAWERVTADGTQWRVLWQNNDYPNNTHTGYSAFWGLYGGAQPSLADVNGDGRPEVVIGNVVLDGLTGALIWDGKVTVGPNAGVGNNAFLGPVSTVADIDLDGRLEVVAGNTVYDGATGLAEWEYTFTSSNSPCGGILPCDGYNGVGNFDDDDFGEVVIVRQGEIFVLEHTGDLKHKFSVPAAVCAHNESGPPTIADFDGDGFAEIGSAGADYYVVYDLQCTGVPLPADCDAEFIRWKVRNQDCSSRVTASSVFDFEGDGKAEVVYADEVNLRVFSGEDGTILFDDATHQSNTRLEMPIVVDVDNDGKSEMVIPEPNFDNDALGGIEVWEDADNNWVRTRRIWNQHGYYVTNITEDGQVPRSQEPNWLNERLNNFRQNVQPSGLFDAPDLVVRSIDRKSCVAGVYTVTVTVGNDGALSVPPGILIHVVAVNAAGTMSEVGVFATTDWLLPGQSEQFDAMAPIPGAAGSLHFVATIDDDGMGNAQYNECDETNNSAQSPPCVIVE